MATSHEDGTGRGLTRRHLLGAGLMGVGGLGLTATLRGREAEQAYQQQKEEDKGEAVVTICPVYELGTGTNGAGQEVYYYYGQRCDGDIPTGDSYGMTFSEEPTIGCKDPSDPTHQSPYCSSISVFRPKTARPGVSSLKNKTEYHVFGGKNKDYSKTGLPKISSVFTFIPNFNDPEKSVVPPDPQVVVFQVQVNGRAPIAVATVRFTVNVAAPDKPTLLLGVGQEINYRGPIAALPQLSNVTPDPHGKDQRHYLRGYDEQNQVYYHILTKTKF